MGAVDLRLDLQERWLPTASQRKRAEALLKGTAAGAAGDHVYTGHLLLYKRWGVWTADVQLVALDGVFTDRLSCLQWTHEAARLYVEAGFEGPLTGGWSAHFLDKDGNEQAAVFDDIGTRFGQD